MEKYNELIKALGLDIPNNWKTDLRDTFILLFKPVIEGSDISFSINKGDHSAKILEIYKTGYKGRIGGISQLRTMDCWIFLSKDFFDIAQKRLALPDNMKPKRSQPHIKISLETVWNILCFLSGKDHLMTK